MKVLGFGLLWITACASPPVFPPWIEAAPTSASEGDSTTADASLAKAAERRSGTLRQPAPRDGGAREDGPRSNDLTGSLSLEEAVLRAIEANPDLGVQRLAPVIAGSFAQIEHGVFDPELFANFQYENERSSRLGDQTRSRFEIETKSQLGEAGLRQRFSSGTEVEVSGRVSRFDIITSPEDPLAQVRVGLSVTQSLLRGFGPAVNLAQIYQAELETEASVHQLEGFAMTVVADVEQAYWNFVLAGREIEIFERSLAFAEQQQVDVQARIEVGLLGPPDAALAEAEVARREQDLIDARSRLTQARLQLARLINAGFDHPLTPEAVADDTPIDMGDVQERVALGRMKRPEISEARARLEQNRLEVMVTRNGVLPQLDLFVNLGRSGFDSKILESIDDLDQGNFDIVGGVRLSQVLGRRAARAERHVAYARREQAERAIDNLSQLVEFEVRQAVNELERAGQQIGASRRTRRLQEIFVDAEQQSFEVGTTTALAVAQAQRDLLAAEIDEARAVVAYRLALVQLYAAEGSLLARRGVRVNVPES